MTLQREEPGIWRAVCDTCGDDETLDGELERDEAEQELADLGWKARPIDRQRFNPDSRSAYTVEYAEHDCEDCA